MNEVLPRLMNIPQASRDLFHSAWQCMRYAERVGDANLKYSLAYRSALRSAAAIVAMCARPDARTAQTRNIWNLLSVTAPELREWSNYYAMQAPLRDAAESGDTSITTRMADDSIRDAVKFIDDAIAVAVNVCVTHAG
jgi:SAV_6107-like HEPN